MQRPTIHRPTMHRHPTGRLDRIQGAVTHPRRRRSQPSKRRGAQPSKSRGAKTRGRGSRGRRLLAVSGAGAAIAYFLKRKEGKRRHHTVHDRAAGTTQPRHHEYDDVTLARKVESEIFRPADAPKGAVNVSAHDGVVELRGQLERRDQIDRLVTAAAKVDGVERVENLLHTPAEPPPHAHA